MTAEDTYLIDLCDRAIEEPAVRGAELPWLREGADPDGPAAVVDAWYPEARAIVLLTSGRDEERSLLLAAAAEAYGVAVLEVPRGWVARDATGALRRLPAEVERMVRLLGDEEARMDNRVWPDTGQVAYGHPDGEEDPEAGDERWSEPPEWGNDPAWLAFQADTEAALGWRGRSVALAVLEAVRISRRAFSVDRVAARLSKPAVEVLLVLLVAGPPDAPFRSVFPRELEALLLRDREELGDALDDLLELGYVRRLSTDPDLADRSVGAEHDWVLTDAGRRVAAEWIARVLPLFAGWPPDVPDVDDAGGPGADAPDP